ncbi:MAG: Crp/Fnr family transcriptional regulator [Acidobacteria bacterium]|nr:Crp/Fnr family transcriptional regulator [Acidobacteriota bacterium]
MSPDDGAGRSRLFEGVADAERAAWLQASSVRDCARGEAVARQGEPADALFLVVSGMLKILQLTPEGAEVLVRFVGPGEPFGGVVAIDGASYPVTAVAVDRTRLRAWPTPTLRRLLAGTPQVRVNIMREMATHMTDAMTRVQELATARVGARIASALLRLVRQSGRPTSDGLLLPFPLTRQELAQLSGTTLYTVSRTLSRWQQQGVLRTTGRRLLISRAAALEALAHVDATDGEP